MRLILILDAPAAACAEALRPAVEALIATAEQAGWSRAEALRAIRREDLLAHGGGADG